MEMGYVKIKTTNKPKKRSLASFLYVHAFESNHIINRIMRSFLNEIVGYGDAVVIMPI